jgi:hypothetical protein
MSFGPIKHRMRRPIPSVTEQRGGGHAIELSHVRPDRQAPAVIGSTIGGHARRNRAVRSTRPFIVEGSRLDSLPIRRSRNRSGPSSPSRSRQRLNGRSNTPASPPFPPRQLAPLMPPEQPFAKRICRTPASTSTRTHPRPLFSFKTGSRATRTKQFTRRCTLGAPNLPIESTTL